MRRCAERCAERYTDRCSCCNVLYTLLLPSQPPWEQPPQHGFQSPKSTKPGQMYLTWRRRTCFASPQLRNLRTSQYTIHNKTKPQAQLPRLAASSCLSEHDGPQGSVAY